MTWRLMCTAGLLTLTLGCDRPDRTPITVVTPSGIAILTEPTTVIAPGMSIVLVSGGSVLTTTVFPATPLTVPRGSTVACVGHDNTPQPGTIAGTVNSGIFVPGGSAPFRLQDTGTFTFGCALQPTVSVTIIVV
jgi:hypothetical protein